MQAIKTKASKAPAKAKFQCDICQKVFHSPQALGPHKRIVHGIRAKKFSEGARGGLKIKAKRGIAHAVAIDEKPQLLMPAHGTLTCPQCGKGPFADRRVLGWHMSRMHDYISPNSRKGLRMKCPVCQQKVKNELGLRFHMAKSHQGMPLPPLHQAPEQSPQSQSTTTVMAVYGVPKCPECGCHLEEYHRLYQQLRQGERKQVVGQLKGEGFKVIEPQNEE